MAGATGCGTIATAILANTNLRQLRISQSSNLLLTATTASDPACGGSGLIENFSLIASATGTPTGILVDGAYAESPDTVRMGNTGLPTLVSLVASNSGTRTPPSVTIGSLQKDLFVQGTMIFVPLQPNLGLNLTGRNINLGGNILVMGDLNIGGGGGP